MGINNPDELEILPLVKGADQYSKVSYPLRYGHYREVRCREYTCQFILNGEIKFITGKNKEYANLELISNFLFTSSFPDNHYPAIFRLIDKTQRD